MKQTKKSVTQSSTAPVASAPTLDAAVIKQMIKKPETIVGAAVLLLVGGFAANAVINSGTQNVEGQNDFPEIVISEPATSSAELTSQPVAEPASVQEIKVLANTSSAKVVVAQSGDTFWKLSIKHCGSDAATELMETANGYGKRRQLQAGDIIEIVCK